jgi:TPR repeat protein
MLAVGIGVPKHEKEAIKWLQKALHGDSQHLHLQEIPTRLVDSAQTVLNELLSSDAASVSP